MKENRRKQKNKETKIENENESNKIENLTLKDNKNYKTDTVAEPKGKKGFGRRKDNVSYIEDKTKRGVCFSKRKRGLIKKAYELGKKTGADVFLIAVNENGHVYTCTTSKFENFVSENEFLLRDYLGNIKFNLQNENKSQEDV